MSARRVMVIGLDCAPPSLVFDRFREHMPCVSRLMERGTWAPLRSTVPPITVPAWTSMVTGRDPGELGLYGFRSRRAGSYALDLVSARDVRVPRVWDRLGDAGKRVAALFVPPTFPPSEVNGVMASCFMTPDASSRWTHPASLATDLETRFGPYVMDVVGPDLDALARMAEQHFAIATYVWETERPDFMMMVEIGLDRFHHGFFRAPDLERFGPAYYALLDRLVGELVARAGDETAVLVVSDHGARPLEGAICVNEWLIEHGWLALERYPEAPVALERAHVDWTRTRAWAEGGYYARVFLNVAGREPSGTIAPGEHERERDRLAALLESIPGPNGERLAHRVVRPELAYRAVRGFAPDLCAFFGDLAWRSAGTVGHRALHLTRDDRAERAADACNHDWDGIFVMAGAGVTPRGAEERFEIYDVNATILALMGVAPEPGTLGVDRSASP